MASGLALLLAAGGTADRLVDRPAPPVAAADEPAPVDALSSAWYCPLTPATRVTPAAGSIVILNTEPGPLAGTATFFAPESAPIDVPFGVPANSRTVLRPSDVVDAAYASTLVRVDGGGAAVEHVIDSALGLTSAPCATTASDDWYVADGSTASGASMLLALFNPFLEDAIIDVSFATSEGPASPIDYQGLVVPARRLVVADVTERLRRRDWIAANIHARSGRLVVDELQFSSYDGAPGLSLIPAAPQTSDVWHFPDGTAVGAVDRVSIFNPSAGEATVDVQVMADGRAPELFPLHVPAQGRTAFDFTAEPRVPRDGRFSVVVRSTNGVPVVAQRSATALPPAGLTGSLMHVGAPEAARRWAVAGPGPVGAVEQPIWIANHGTRRATATVTITGAGTSTAFGPGFVIEPGARAFLPLHDPAVVALVPDAAVVVVSDEPVIVGRSIVRPPQGFTGSLAVRLADP